MTIVEALKKSKRIRRAGMEAAGTWLELTRYPARLVWQGACSPEDWVAYDNQILAEDWEPVMDRKEEIAEKWAKRLCSGEFYTGIPTHLASTAEINTVIIRASKDAILGALREYAKEESGSVEAHIKAHERLNP